MTASKATAASERWASNLNAFERAGADWWNSLSENDRRGALIAAQEAGLPCTAADAYRLHLRKSSDAAKLALFDRLVAACRESLSFVGDYETGEPLAEKLEALLAEARKLQ